MDPVRLACVKHAASVRPEPGSNSPSRTSHTNVSGVLESLLVSRGNIPCLVTPTTDLIVVIVSNRFFDCFQSILSSRMGYPTLN